MSEKPKVLGVVRLSVGNENQTIILKIDRIARSVRHLSDIIEWCEANGKGLISPTAQDIARIRAAAGESTTRLAAPKPRGSRWTATTVQAVLTGRSLLGEYVRANGSVVRNDDGSPVMRSEPVLNEEEWAKLSEAVALVKYKKQKGSTSPTVGMTFCLPCGSPIYYVKGNQAKSQRERYRCHGNKSQGIKACPKQTFWAEDLYPWLESPLLGEIGHLERMESTTTIDDSRAARLAVIDGKMNQLLKELQQDELSAVSYASQVASLAQEREKVTSQDGPKPVTVWTGTGESYAEWWQRSSIDERREFLKKHKVRAYFRTDVLAIDPGDLIDNLRVQGTQCRDVRTKRSQVMQPIEPVWGFGDAPTEKSPTLTGVAYEIVSSWEEFEVERARERAGAVSQG